MTSTYFKIKIQVLGIQTSRIHRLTHYGEIKFKLQNAPPSKKGLVGVKKVAKCLQDWGVATPDPLRPLGINIFTAVCFLLSEILDILRLETLGRICLVFLSLGCKISFICLCFDIFDVYLSIAYKYFVKNNPFCNKESLKLIISNPRP